jgi:Sigma-70 region 2
VEDLVQNTLTDALISANAPSDPSDFQRWVYGIARHKIADSYRRRGRLPVVDADVGTKAGDAEAGELAQWIERELPKSDGAHATLHWLLRESDGESLDEIARDAALPAPRVRQRVSRLRRHFHARWLALGAAGLILLLAACLLLHGTREPSAAPPIARERPTPRERTSGQAVDPAQPVPSAPATAPESKKGNTLKRLAPSKTRSNDVQPKATPKERQQKLKPLSAKSSSSNALPGKSSSSNALPGKSSSSSKPGVLDYNDLGDSKPVEQLPRPQKMD